MSRLTIDDDTRVLVLTGAGVSAESGIPTFRDTGGLWESYRFEDVASPAGFARDPQLVWRFYSERRAGLAAIEPNPGHRALAALEERLGERFLLATQNVDGLHQRAGNRRVLELHGNILETRCTRCDRAPFADVDGYRDRVPVCGQCHARGEMSALRPNVVWFGELLDGQVLARLEAFISEAGPRLLFLAAGTSGSVYPAAGLVDVARAVGGRSVLVNRDPSDNAGAFDEVILGNSGEVLPALLGEPG